MLLDELIVALWILRVFIGYYFKLMVFRVFLRKFKILY